MMTTKTINADTLQPNLLKKTGSRKKKLQALTTQQGFIAKIGHNGSAAKLYIIECPIDSLKPASRRVRRASSAQVDRLKRSIASSNTCMPIVVAHGQIVDGHSRLEALRQLGRNEVQVIDISFMTVPEREHFALSVNRIAERGEWDLDQLREAVIELKVEGFDLTTSGFTDIECDAIMIDPLNDGPAPLDELPPETALVTSRLGDLWLLAGHRLICGSATEEAVYKILMGGKRADALVTDPPFNVKIAGNVSGLGKVKHGEFVQASGEMSDADFSDMLSTFAGFSRAELITAAPAYIFMDWRHFAVLQMAAEAVGFTLINLVIWDKGSGGMGSMYRSQHEMLPMFCNGASSPVVNNVKLGKHGRDRTNVWAYPSAARGGGSTAKALKDHPTPKPVALIADVMLDCTHTDAIVLDPFVGSGTAIIAAHEVGRHAYGIELDPKFVDLAVRRWEQATGEIARLSETGETFAEVSERRLQLAEI